jgi:peptidyl-prolyl cis-trans isomerase A (cyclophilin A)
MLKHLYRSLALLLCFSLHQAMANDTADISKALIYTAMGTIEIELYAAQAPAKVTNFVRYITSGAYNKGQFYRVVRLDNDNGSPKIEVLQGGANPEFSDFDPIPLETTASTGIKHLNGTLSMARDEPSSATSAFFICIGAQPALDFAGARNPDGQGFAAFGRVIMGMDIVKAILAIKAAKATDDDYVKGRILQDPLVIEQIKLLYTHATSK